MTINEAELRKLAERARDAGNGSDWIACGPSFGEPLPQYLTEVMVIGDDGATETTVCLAPDWDKDRFEERSALMEHIAAANPATIIALLDDVASTRRAATLHKQTVDALTHEAESQRAEIATLKECVATHKQSVIDHAKMRDANLVEVIPGAVPEAAAQNGGLVRAALIDLLTLEHVTLSSVADFKFYSDASVRFARARAALAATTLAATPAQPIAPTELTVELRRWAGECNSYAACMFRRAADQIELFASRLRAADVSAPTDEREADRVRAVCNPEDFGVPAEWAERAQHYANWFAARAAAPVSGPTDLHQALVDAHRHEFPSAAPVSGQGASIYKDSEFWGLLDGYRCTTDTEALRVAGKALAAYIDSRPRNSEVSGQGASDERVPGIGHPTTYAELASITPLQLWNRWRPLHAVPARDAFIAARTLPFIDSRPRSEDSRERGQVSDAADAARYRWLLSNYARGDGYHAIDAALNDGEADLNLSPAIDAQIAAIQAQAGDAGGAA